MKKFGELFSSKRKQKRLSISRVSEDLVISRDHISALEEEDWAKLPESPYVKGYIKSYAHYLGIDADYVLAIYRREYDESKFPKKTTFTKEKRFFITPNRILNFTFIIAIAAFILYITIQYSSLLSSPKLEITSPQNNESTSVPAVKVEGITAKDATVSVNGNFALVDENGNFTYEYMLKEGKNDIEIISSLRLSPKKRINRTVRLIQ